MNTNQKIFLLINIVGGILVLGSYYFGLKSGKGVESLWGGVPTNIRSVYALSMLLSAIGYFAFFTYIFKGLGLNTFVGSFILGEKLYLLLFTLILGASALWMPFVNIMVTNPSASMWILIRVVLIIVALASLGVFLSLLSINPRPTGALYYSAVIGMLWFTLHTGILDAILWTHFWK